MGFDVTAHGFRFSFGIWAAEMTDFAPDVIAMALAQKPVSDGMLESHRQLMNDWAAFLDSASASP